jgi:membrane protein insertase Oxa1/YidC/SpoIIIJ
MKFLPFLWPIFLLTLPTGLAVYALVSNLYRIGQQGFITRTMFHKTDEGHYKPKPGTKEIITTVATEVPKTPVVPPKAKNRPAPTGKKGEAPVPKPSPSAKKDQGSTGKSASNRPAPSSEAKKSSNRPTPRPKPKPGSGRDKS